MIRTFIKRRDAMHGVSTIVLIKYVQIPQQIPHPFHPSAEMGLRVERRILRNHLYSAPGLLFRGYKGS